MKDLQIAILTVADALDLSYLLTVDNSDYRKYFLPFDTTPQSLSAMLANTREDRFWGIRSGPNLIGMFMLRGLDQGYQIPSFGVYIAQKSSGKGLSKLALHYVLAWCRLNECEAIILSVHPNNVYARRVYETTGFQFTGKFSELGHRIYQKRFSA